MVSETSENGNFAHGRINGSTLEPRGAVLADLFKQTAIHNSRSGRQQETWGSLPVNVQ